MEIILKAVSKKIGYTQVLDNINCLFLGGKIYGIVGYNGSGKTMLLRTIVFTLIAWGAGLLLDANIHFGDPQGFLCLRVLLPVLAMGLCLLRAIKENKRDGDK